VPGWGDGGLPARPWRDAEFVVVDLETTGLDLRRDEIVSYGAVVVREGRALARTAVYGLVRPVRPVSREAVEVHALRPEDLAGAPPLAEQAPVLAALLRGRVLVAHAAWVEQAFLGRALRLAGARFDGPVVDTAALARETLVARDRDEGEPSLERLAAALRLPVHTPHHALGDALTTANVFLALAGRLDVREPQTVRTLTAVSRRRSLR
jgi:DNA polymerase-3 subunit epsilon